MYSLKYISLDTQILVLAEHQYLNILSSPFAYIYILGGQQELLAPCVPFCLKIRGRRL